VHTSESFSPDTFVTTSFVFYPMLEKLLKKNVKHVLI